MITHSAYNLKPDNYRETSLPKINKHLFLKKIVKTWETFLYNWLYENEIPTVAN